MSQMQDKEFSLLAEKTISLIAEIIENEDKNCLIDVDCHGDILNLTTQAGVFVINKHSEAKEIWLSSPTSGPYHFAYSSGSWKSRASIDLLKLLESELKINFNNAVF